MITCCVRSGYSNPQESIRPAALRGTAVAQLIHDERSRQRLGPFVTATRMGGGRTALAAIAVSAPQRAERGHDGCGDKGKRACVGSLPGFRVRPGQLGVAPSGELAPLPFFMRGPDRQADKLNSPRFSDRLLPVSSSKQVMTQMAGSTEYDPEYAVIEAIQEGDHDAFREFLERQDRWVRGIVFAVLGNRRRLDDVVQQVWTTVWERIGDLRDVRVWRSWLYRLVRNAAVDAGRDTTRSRQLATKLADDTRPTHAVSTPPDEMTASEQQRAVLDAIEALPAMYREPFTLRHLEGWSYAQIGELLDLPVDTVETRLVRARRRLRNALAGKV